MIQPITEAGIWEKVVASHDADLSREAARALLELRFDPDTTRLIRQQGVV